MDAHIHEWKPVRIDLGERLPGEFVCRICGEECPKAEAERLEALLCD